MSRNNVVPALLLILVATLVSADETPNTAAVSIGLNEESLPREVTEYSGEIRGLWRDGRVYIGGQPDESALKHFQAQGVGAVVNLRTPEEMDDRERVPYDEAAVVSELGMEYIHIPLGGEEHPYTPEAVARFADVLHRTEGPILVHCTVGWRASYIWSAYLVTEHGFDINTAMARGKAMAIGDLPIEGLLGLDLELTVVN
jgi:uncharacterized protein (TIGR01244 family)